MKSKNITRRTLFKYLWAFVFVFAKDLYSADESSRRDSAKQKGEIFASSRNEVEKELNYIANARFSQDKKYRFGSKCGSCKFYFSSSEKSGFAPCLMMSRRLVSSNGWCNLYTEKILKNRKKSKWLIKKLI